MKKFNFIIGLVLLVPMLGYSQQKQLTKVDNNLYEYVVTNGQIVTQKGFYKKINGEYVIHGTWSDLSGTRAYYENGKLIWIKPKGDKKYTHDEIELHRLRRKVEKLEDKLASN